MVKSVFVEHLGCVVVVCCFGGVCLLFFPFKDCLKTHVKVNINFCDSLMTLF